MQHQKTLRSDTLLLIASTATHVRTELETPERLPLLLDANVSNEWPSGEYDQDAMEFFLARFEEGGENAIGWYSWYALNYDQHTGQRSLVGAGGYFGPPDEHGTVEIGYSVLPEWQRRGYASEIVKLLVERAFSFPNITTIKAHTAQDNMASSQVLTRSGFQQVEIEPDTSLIRFELQRSSNV